jgi:ribosomal protein L18
VPPEERRLFRPTDLNDLADRLLGPTPEGQPRVDLTPLSDPQPIPTAILDKAAALSSTLEELPAYRGLVHRGIRATQAQLESYQPGTTITELGFTSTTRAVENSFGGDVDVLIASRTGKAIAEHSARPEEDEVLFDHGTSFDVLAVDTDQASGRRVVVAREATTRGGTRDLAWQQAATTDSVLAAVAAFLQARAQVPPEQRRALDYAKFTPALGANGKDVITSTPTPP